MMEPFIYSAPKSVKVFNVFSRIRRRHNVYVSQTSISDTAAYDLEIGGMESDEEDEADSSLISYNGLLTLG